MSEKSKMKIILNEEELIRQIALRPLLYDRTLKAYRKLTLRHQYWKQVSEAMGCSVEDCRRRWRSLRDSYAKKHKLANRTQIKWPFYKQMAFITPYLDNSCGEIDDNLDDFADNSNDDDIVNIKLPQQLELSQPRTLQPIHLTADIHADDIKFDASTASKSESPITKDSENVDNSNSNARNFAQHDDSTMVQLNQQQAADSEEKFLLSCAPVLRRLSARKNAFARLKIQQLLYEIEFDDQLNG